MGWENDAGDIMRIVRKVVLRLNREDKFICVQVADWKLGRLELAIALPSQKLRMGEMEVSHSCMERFLLEDFELLHPAIVLGSYHNHKERKPSPRFGIDTVYYETIFEATLDVGFNPSSLYLVRVKQPSDACCSLAVDIKSWDAFISRHEGLGWRLFAWMSENDFDQLLELDGHAKDLIVDFLHTFNLPE